MCNKHREKLKKINTDISSYSPAQFAQIISNGQWKPAPHLLMLDEYLQRLIDREFRGLIVNMPPRHGKSEFISQYFPAWHLVRFPEKRIILTAYSNQFASIWGRKVKEIILANKELFGIKLNPLAHSSSSFEIAGSGGGMHSAGAGSSITGRGADLLIVDDPVKNNMDVKSAIKRDILWDWFNSTALTRLEPFGIAVLLMTRWHPDDLCGRILEKYNVLTFDKLSDRKDRKIWLHLSMPAIAKAKDILGRSPGDALWPARFDINELENIKNQLGSHWFEAMYQQNPLRQNDALFKSKDFRYFTQQGDFYLLGGNTKRENSIYKNDCSIFISVDLAVKAKESSDYTVAIVFAVTPDNRILLLDIFRDKVTGREQIRALTNLYKKWQPLSMGIESVQFQTAIIYQLLDMGYNIKKLTPTNDKYIRAQGISLRLANGLVYFRAKAHWLNDFEKELLEFPSGRHDDQVDAFAYIDKMIVPKNAGLPTGKTLRKTITRGFV